MSSTTLPVCPKTGSTSPSLTVHLCLHTVPGNRECAPIDFTHPRRLNRQQILTLGTCARLAERHNLIVTGPCDPGS